MSCNAVQESDSSLKKRSPRNSPMKINEVEEKERTLKVWDCGSPLYDSYELVSVSHIIERHFMVFPYLSKSRNVDESRPISSSSSSVDQSKPNKAAGPSKVRRFSVVNFLSDLVEGNLWKRKQLDAERKVNSKPKKQKKRDFSE
ncbi:unnamed protein product [Fraxinus pennsylvanica]|uniref:Uncharacterized protein n=1 Tax=Fraxinus pennsylvanica TaxID=56036 RepID=A0AAD2DR84_9LAMI|nr:unnamed protein product [Fraxinus pennsylvanica]